MLRRQSLTDSVKAVFYGYFYIWFSALLPVSGPVGNCAHAHRMVFRLFRSVACRGDSAVHVAWPRDDLRLRGRGDRRVFVDCGAELDGDKSHLGFSSHDIGSALGAWTGRGITVLEPGQSSFSAPVACILSYARGDGRHAVGAQ